MDETRFHPRTLAQRLAQEAAAAYRQDDFEAAELLFAQAAQADPATPAYRCNLATARLSQGKGGLAETELLASMDPLEALDCATLGLVLKTNGASAEAQTWLRRALMLDPGQSAARLNLANLMAAQGLSQDAIRLMREGLTESPGDWRLANNLGLALHEAGEVEEALAIFTQALALAPQSPELRLNLAHSLLISGRWKEGFAAYEARPLAPLPDAARRWDGREAQGATLLVKAEQGFGDAIQFARFLSLAKARVARVVLSCDGILHRLFEGLADLADESREAPAHDLCCHLLSLPHLLGLEAPEIFCATPYLTPPPARPLAGRFKVGFVWAGRAGHANDKNRSLDGALLAPLVGIEGIAAYSLQIGKGAPPAGLVDLASGIADLHDTAACIAALDLLISVDTAPAHLAGALGKPVWTLLPFAPDWRWGLAGETTPWYPSMRLFRQTRPCDWAEVVARVATALERAVHSGNPSPS